MVYSFDLSSKIILITGGYGHLGKAITESLIFHGATVYVLGRDEDKFLSEFKEHTALRKTLFFQVCDISESDSITEAFNSVFNKAKRIDVLINNAVYSEGQSPETMTDEQWSTGVEGILSSVFKAIKHIIPYYKKSGKGKIINVSSMYGVIAPDFSLYEDYAQFLNPPHYGAAKAGVIQLTKYYASYLGKLNINVNAVIPGPFPSASVQQTTGFIKELSERTLLNRIGQPADVAGAFVFLSSDAADFITGQNIIVDGGWTAK